MVMKSTMSIHFNGCMGFYDQNMVNETEELFDGHEVHNVYRFQWLYGFL